MKYGDQVVGEFFVDILVEEEVTVELKAISKLNRIHEMQLVNYLVATGIDIGILINFPDEKVEVKRKVRVLQ